MPLLPHPTPQNIHVLLPYFIVSFRSYMVQCCIFWSTIYCQAHLSETWQRCGRRSCISTKHSRSKILIAAWSSRCSVQGVGASWRALPQNSGTLAKRSCLFGDTMPTTSWSCTAKWSWFSNWGIIWNGFSTNIRLILLCQVTYMYFHSLKVLTAWKNYILLKAAFNLGK